ncbi:hypothetical protein MPTK1_3g00020 [Marchantia polymorpha subsp. ruderalis]|uniref:Chorein N-terminal domain-containing protein n=2 Tax=Marchantia polymorpha TaxID=3197 RepID=A0AAF6AVR1_MARPO|nr:hypothetical protein MARPO_0007s0002 [Marchantia polymorpha]BBN03845.1 hypothetical protein Mp_3g00020 [Marchantia polymorpha subsp. ruderalis]PTQ47538.1 hypothetical protein MARPO_0007s0002 [Marchantia polymorpha]PTQ47539.1 hypothetical protein MARPO_0007s0002 [Marchantia polymorpha]PTQ47540.1 hypothetical protein MARPO_0007s0002 [Marchantia polymorpha]|eukprot:PTQ47537.1 hypothetical protein MARPO_0007s0002 [Marchantia polymorpha]
MESILVRALESKLKYWLRSFTRDQFKLQGRSVHLYNLDLNGDVLHAAIGLPPTLRVAQARVGRFELKLPSLSNVNSEPVVVEIDKLDLVLVETAGNEEAVLVTGTQATTTPTKVASTGYGYADKIADGLTITVGTVNLMLETRGGGGAGGASWTPPLASITIRNLLLYSTNEHWKVVNLTESRKFFANKKCIYVFKKLEWESLSVDLLPHPDMFADENLPDTDSDSSRDNVGAKRMFFGGERFLDSISGAAYITMHRTEQNNPIALEVQVHIPETLCPALSEPGLRALLRFMTGVYVCINRGDVDRKKSTEAAGRTMVKVTVDHVFLCIKDADFQLELLMQSLNYIRASAGDGDCSRTMSRLELGHLFLRDTFSNPSCTLVQPSMRNAPTDFPPVPSFASEKLWPRIYPLDSRLIIRDAAPMMCMFASQTTPAPEPPALASQMVVQCQPLKINLQEESCIRIASFLADGVTVRQGVVTPETSLNAIYFSLKEFDLTVPLKANKSEEEDDDGGFTGVRLHVEGFMVAQSPFLTFRMLDLDGDPACFPFWKGQPVDSSQQRWVMRSTHISVALETGRCDDSAQNSSTDWDAGLWRCVVMAEPCLEAAMVTGDGKPLISVPPPGGIVRLGVSCKSYTCNASSEQLLFVLKMYGYMMDVSQTLVRVSKGLETVHSSAGVHSKTSSRQIAKHHSFARIAPDDSAVIIRLVNLELKLLESVPGQVAVEGPPLVQIFIRGICLKATHRTLGGAAAISSALCFQDVRVECVETELCSPIAPVSLMNAQFKENLRRARSNCDQLNSMEQASASESIPSMTSESSGTDVMLQDDVYPASKQQGSHNVYSTMRSVLWIGDERGSMARAEATTNGNSRIKRTPFLEVAVVHMIPLRKEDVECHSLKVSAKIAGVRLGGGMVYTEALLQRFGVLQPDGSPGEVVNKVMSSLSSGPLADFLRPTAGAIPVSTEVDNKGWEMGRPHDIDLDLQLQDWLFALEGAEGVAEGPSCTEDSVLTREQKCWHTTFRLLKISASGRKLDSEDSPLPTEGSSLRSPVQNIKVRIEGLQALKPILADELFGSGTNDHNWASFKEGFSQSDGYVLAPEKRSGRPVNLNVTNSSGINLEVNLIENTEDPEVRSGHWVVESIQAAVKEPIEVRATKREVEYLVQRCQLEVESASRVAAGVLKLLQLQGPFGQSAIDQLNDIGSGSLEKILTPDKTSRRLSSRGTLPSTSPFSRHKQVGSKVELTVGALEAAVERSRKLCASLRMSLFSSEIGGSSDSDKQLSSKSSLENLSLVAEQLQNMEALISNLKSEIH